MNSVIKIFDAVTPRKKKNTKKIPNLNCQTAVELRKLKTDALSLSVYLVSVFIRPMCICQSRVHVSIPCIFVSLISHVSFPYMGTGLTKCGHVFAKNVLASLGQINTCVIHINVKIFNFETAYIVRRQMIMTVNTNAHLVLPKSGWIIISSQISSHVNVNTYSANEAINMPSVLYKVVKPIRGSSVVCILYTIMQYIIHYIRVVQQTVLHGDKD